MEVESPLRQKSLNFKHTSKVEPARQFSLSIKSSSKSFFPSSWKGDSIGNQPASVDDVTEVFSPVDTDQESLDRNGSSSSFTKKQNSLIRASTKNFSRVSGRFSKHSSKDIIGAGFETSFPEDYQPIIEQKQKLQIRQAQDRSNLPDDFNPSAWGLAEDDSRLNIEDAIEDNVDNVDVLVIKNDRVDRGTVIAAIDSKSSSCSSSSPVASSTEKSSLSGRLPSLRRGSSKGTSESSIGQTKEAKSGPIRQFSKKFSKNFSSAEGPVHVMSVKSQTGNRIAVNDVTHFYNELHEDENDSDEEVALILDDDAALEEDLENDIVLNEAAKEKIKQRMVDSSTRTASGFLVSKLQDEQIMYKKFVSLQYCTTDPAYNLLVLFQNVSRKEMGDMFYMITSMKKRKYYMDRDEIEIFYEWFSSSTYLINKMFVYEDLLFDVLQKEKAPSAEDAEAFSKTLADIKAFQQSQMEGRQRILDALEDILDFRAVFSYGPPGARIDDLHTKITNYINTTSDYQQNQFKQLLPLFKIIVRDIESEEKVVINSVKALRSKKEPHLTYHAVMKALDSELVDTKDFKDRINRYYVQSYNPVKMMTFGKESNKARSKFRTHRKVVKKYYSKWCDFEKSKQQKN